MSEPPADPMDSVKAHDAKVTLQDLQTEIAQARSQLDQLQARIGQERAEWETELAGLRAERRRLHEEPPDEPDGEGEGEGQGAGSSEAPEAPETHRHPLLGRKKPTRRH